MIWVWCSVSDLPNGTLNPHLGLHATQDCSTPHQMTGSVSRWQSYGCTDTNKWFVRWAANRDSLMLRPVLSQLKLQFKVGGGKSHKSTRMWTWFWLKYNLLCSFPQFLSSWQTYCFGSLFSLLYKSCFGSTGCVVGVHYYLCYRVIYNLLLLPSGGQKYLLSQFKLTSNVQTLELENLCSCACLCGGASLCQYDKWE